MAVKYEADEKPEVQLTSMMDCIFLMLIFFLVSSQLKKKEKEVALELPESDAAVIVSTPAELTTISVDEKGALYVNSKPVGAAGLRAALAETARAAAEKGGRMDRRVRIDGDVNAPFRSVVQVLDTCKAEGLNVVGIHTAANVK